MVGTHYIQSVNIINCTFIAHYIQDSLALGAFIVMILSTTEARFTTIYKNESYHLGESHHLRNASELKLFIYDIENDGKLVSGKNEPAMDTVIPVSNHYSGKP